MFCRWTWQWQIGGGHVLCVHNSSGNRASWEGMRWFIQEKNLSNVLCVTTLRIEKPIFKVTFKGLIDMISLSLSLFNKYNKLCFNYWSRVFCRWACFWRMEGGHVLFVPKPSGQRVIWKDMRWFIPEKNLINVLCVIMLPIEKAIFKCTFWNIILES